MFRVEIVCDGALYDLLEPFTAQETARLARQHPEFRVMVWLYQDQRAFAWINPPDIEPALKKAVSTPRILPQPTLSTPPLSPYAQSFTQQEKGDLPAPRPSKPSPHSFSQHSPASTQTLLFFFCRLFAESLLCVLVFWRNLRTAS